jgi:hypothetical protein
MGKIREIRGLDGVMCGGNILRGMVGCPSRVEFAIAIAFETAVAPARGVYFYSGQLAAHGHLAIGH